MFIASNITSKKKMQKSKQDSRKRKSKQTHVEVETGQSIRWYDKGTDMEVEGVLVNPTSWVGRKTAHPWGMFNKLSVPTPPPIQNVTSPAECWMCKMCDYKFFQTSTMGTSKEVPNRMFSHLFSTHFKAFSRTKDENEQKQIESVEQKERDVPFYEFVKEVFNKNKDY